MSKLRVLVVGASIAGPTAAYWFAKAGASVTVIERFPKMRTGGQKIDIHTAGVTVIATGNPDQQSIVSEYEIFRGDLAQIIFNLTEDNENIKYVFGEQVVLMQQNDKADGRVTVEFANGSPTSEYDLVVACDGATSRTRAIGLGCSVREYIETFNCWAA